MISIKLFLSLVIPCLVGHLILSGLLGKKHLNIIVSSAVSFGLGLGVLTQGMLFLGMVGVRYSIVTITAVFIGAGILLYVLCRMFLKQNRISDYGSLLKGPDNDFYFQGPGILNTLLVLVSLIFISCYAYSIFWLAMNIPVFTWDSISTSVYNAQILFYERSLHGYAHFVRAQYPLHLPMVLSWISIILGEWNDQLIKIIFPLMFFSFIIVFNAFLRHYTNKKWALFGVVLLFSSNLLVYHAAISYRDIFMIYYNCLTIMFLVLWRDQKQQGLLVLASLFAGFATFTKLEGTAYFVTHCLLMMCILAQEHEIRMKEKIKSFLTFLIPGMGIGLFYYLFKMAMGVSTASQLGLTTSDVLGRAGAVLQAYYSAIFFTGNWNITWMILLLSFVFNYEKVKKIPSIRILFLALILILVMQWGIAVTFDIGLDMIVSFTISRLILHFFPLAVLLIVLLNAPHSLQED